MSKIVAFLMMFFSASAGFSETLKMVGDNWAPYTDQEGTNPGFVTELASLAASKLGYETIYEVKPWAQALANIKEGKSDLLLGMMESQVQSERLILVKEPFCYRKVDLFTPKDSKWTFKGLDSLNGHVLSVVEDYQYEPAIRGYIAENSENPYRIVFCKGEIPIQISIKKVLSGRADVLVEDRLVVLWNARQLGVENKLRLAGTSGKPAAVMMAVSPRVSNAAALAEKISATLKELKKTPECAKIMEKYGVASTQ